MTTKTSSSGGWNWRATAREIGIVVAGILIAFALDSWWDRRNDARREAAYLLALHADFQENLERLRGHLLSVSIPAESRMHGVEVGELRLPPGAAVTLVVRDDKSFVPSPTTVLRRGDELLVVATDPVRDRAEQRLRAVGQGGKLAGWLGTG